MKINTLFKVLVQIFLMISISFVISMELNMPLVSAADAPDVCCEKVSGGQQYCQQVQASKCEGTAFPGECAYFSNCKPVCCDLSESLQGCMKNVPAASCIAKGGTILSDASCNYDQCKPGCGVVGSNCIYTTEQNYNKIIADYPSLIKDFRRDIGSEVECQQVCLSKASGCCVLKSDGKSLGTCKKLTGDECAIAGGEFREGVACSDLKNDCAACVAKASTGCLEGSEEVHYFDACGNPEGVAEDCDYIKGNLCGNKTGTASCEELNCDNVWDNSRNPFDSNGGEKKLGESWCQYDGSAGPALDLPGSRHFRHYCYNGIEYSEECRDYREEFCVEATAQISSSLTYSVAGCKKNRYQDCSEIKDRESCDDTTLRDCYWISTDKKSSEDNLKELQHRVDKKYQGNASVIYSKIDKEGYCIPLVPPGQKFWETDREGLCSKANSGGDIIPEIKSYWSGYNPGSCDVGGFSCDSGCRAYKDSFSENVNNLCRSYSDCGADYNLVGQWTNNGFFKECGTSFDAYCDQGLINNCKNKIEDPEQFVKNRAMYNNTLYFGILDLSSGFSSSIDSLKKGAWSMGAIAVASGAVALGVSLGTGLTTGLAFGLGTSGLSGFPFLPAIISSAVFAWVGIATATILAVLLVVLLVGKKTEIDTTEVQCKTWEAPKGDLNCDLCNVARDGFDFVAKVRNEELHPCNEYLCRSLGKSCQYIETDKGGICQGGLCNVDVNSPVIKFESANCTKTDGSACSGAVYANGYKIAGKLKPYTPFTFTIKTVKSGLTSEYADCRWSFNNSAKFENLEMNFDQSGYSDEHTKTIDAVNIKPGSNYTIYASCEDNCGNAMNRLYAISFEVSNEPDLTPPKMLKFIPESPGYIAADKDNKNIKIILDEPVYGMPGSNNVPGCRYDFLDVSYDNMSFGMSATQINIQGYKGYAGVETVISNLTTDGTKLVYFRCKDQSGNTNQEGWPTGGYELIKSKPLKIDLIKCLSQGSETCGDIYSSNVTLQVYVAEGARNGESSCWFGKDNGNGKIAGFRYELGFENKTAMHQIPLMLSKGEYKLAVECEDVAGNLANASTSFNILKDDTGSKFIKIYSDSQFVYLVTDEKSTCKYSTSLPFNYNTATEISTSDDITHMIAFENSPYFIVQCNDRFGNPGDQTTVNLLKKD